MKTTEEIKLEIESTDNFIEKAHKQAMSAKSKFMEGDANKQLAKALTKRKTLEWVLEQ